MHALKPNTKYKLVKVTLAMPADIDDAGICDGVNDLLRANCTETFIADWELTGHKVASILDGKMWDAKETDSDPEEGELFSDREPSREELVEALQSVLTHCVTPKGFPDQGKGRTAEQQAAYDKARAILAKTGGAQ